MRENCERAGVSNGYYREMIAEISLEFAENLFQFENKTKRNANTQNQTESQWQQQHDIIESKWRNFRSRKTNGVHI